MADISLDKQASAQGTLDKLLFATLKEQRVKRRWGIFFKLIFWGYLFAMLGLFWPGNTVAPLNNKDTDHSALIDVKGEIADTEVSNADNIAAALRNAFADKHTKGVLLRINSPGGSAVQAFYIYDEIIRLRALHPRIPIYAVCSETCASAAYLMASATDKIYANPASFVGSIGVLMEGFGFVDIEKKFGVERRLITAGEHKGFFDPFSPLAPGDVQYAKTMLDDVHQQFIAAVLKGRGKRLKVTADTFSGLVWTGHQALPQGLIDGYGSTAYVAREIIKHETIVDYSVKPNPLEQFANRLGIGFYSRIANFLSH